MKKIVFVVLAAMLLLCMTPTAFASSAKLDNNITSTDLDVQAAYRASESEATISVDITWTGLNFTYNGTQVWDAAAHKYVDGTSGGWAASAAAITITNHSNTILQADLRFDAQEGFDEIDMIFTANAPYIGSAYTNENGGEACSITIPLIPDGTLPESATQSTAIGTITVSVQPVTNMTHQAIAAKFSELYLKMSEQDHTVRGAAYFKDPAAEEAFRAALEGISDVDATNVTAMNAALNSILTTYYNGLTIRQ